MKTFYFKCPRSNSLSVRPDGFVKTRQQLWSRLRIGNQDNGPAARLEQPNQSVILLSAKLVDPQLGDISRAFTLAISFRFLEMSLLPDVLFFDLDQISHQISDSKDEQHGANHRDHGENVFLSQAVVQVVDTNDDPLYDSSRQALRVLI